MEIQVLPFADLRRMILDGETDVHSLPNGSASDSRIVQIKGLRSRLTLYAEHRWQVRDWCARKARRDPPGPIVA